MATATAFEYFGLCVAAFLAGGVNALAGGGTLLTFPTLIGVLSRQFGVAAERIANQTSTAALVPATIGSAWAFRRELFHLRRFLVWLLPPSLIGGAVGAFLVTELPPEYFKWLVPWLVLGAAVMFTLQPYVVRRLGSGSAAGAEICDADTKIPPRSLAGMILMQFLIAIYGGYFGAGIGILMLAGLGLMGLSNIHQMNGLKAILGLAINGMALVVFQFRGDIVWPYALAMAATSLVGGYVAAHYSRQVPGKYVRWLVIVIGFSLATYYFWKQFGPQTPAASV